MIHCETNLKEIPATRYRRLAGPFRSDAEAPLFDRVTAYLRATGARIATVHEPDGAVIWRLRSECETYEQTANRLRRNRRRNPLITDH